MAPAAFSTGSKSFVPIRQHFVRRSSNIDGHWRDGSSTGEIILESWSEGIMVGALVIMACISIAAMRKQVMLHKLILLEVRKAYLCQFPQDECP
jgi:hypothetical protein